MQNLIIVSSKTQLEQLKSVEKNVQVMTAENYLKNEHESHGPTRVFNLCNDYSYCKKGYYVSLLAEARKHKPLPNVSTLSDLQNKDTVKILSDDILDNLNRSLKEIKGEQFEISIYFGRNIAHRYDSLAKQIFNIYQAPLLRVFCEKKDEEWTIKSVRTIGFREVPESHLEFLMTAMDDFFGSHKSISKPKAKHARYDLAILCNEKEELPPSDSGALKSFIRAAHDLRIHAEIVSPKDIGLLNRFDALFIRETTNVFDHTYKFAKHAELEGLVVIDDSQSILKCCNKIYLHDMLQKKGLSTPKTYVIYKNTDLTQFKDYPLIIKKPDSAFSKGVKKLESLEDLQKQAAEYFKKSDLLIVQEFLQTDFDWRIGVIDDEPLYVCRYHMATNHWQIIKREGEQTKEGHVDTLAVAEAPKKAVQLALKACKEIGHSLYGVDIKEKNGQFYVIEVNDNPSIEKGWEDKVLGQQLYHKIMATFLRRLESR